MSYLIKKNLRSTVACTVLVGMTTMLSACGFFSDNTEEVIKDDPIKKPVLQPNYAPKIDLSALEKGNRGAGIDYIIDGSASMCGYFQAKPDITDDAILMKDIVQKIQSGMSDRDNLLIFMQDESADKAKYIPFSKYRNKIIQGTCQLNGQYTELGIILKAYNTKPRLKNRSVAIISDMHFLPQEETNWSRSYSQLVNDTVEPRNSPNASNGILSIRSPFVGNYYTVNNDKFNIEQVMKHIHIFWFAKNTSEAEEISELQVQLKKTPNAIFSQAEFLPQVKLLSDSAKEYKAYSSPAYTLKPTDVFAIPSNGIENASDILLESPNQILPFLSAYEEGIELTEEQKHCYTLNWSGDAIEFYPYPNASTNSIQSCTDDNLFRSKTGGTVRLNIPIKREDIQLKASQPSSLAVSDGFVSLPVIDRKGSCIGISTGLVDEQTSDDSFSVSYSGSNTSIDTSYYEKFTLSQDNVCTADGKCDGLKDKTYLYEDFIASFANDAKKAIAQQYPKELTVDIDCK